MIGTLIGAGLSLAGQLYGQYKSRQATEDAQRRIEEENRANQAWYDRRYNEDPTQRADAQRMINLVSERMKQRNRFVDGAQAVTGATDERVAQEKAVSANAMSDAVAQIAAQAEGEKSAVDREYMSRRGYLSNNLSNMDLQRANNTAQAVANLSNVAGGIVNAFGTKLNKTGLK